jgi:hypothetical protein
MTTGPSSWAGCCSEVDGARQQSILLQRERKRKGIGVFRIIVSATTRGVGEMIGPLILPTHLNFDLHDVLPSISSV